MRFSHKTSLCLSGLVFAVLLFTGFLLSQRKVLWGDEFFTQKISIDTQSYTNILTSNFPDGNKCPLFYIIQKINSDLFAYKLPVADLQGIRLIFDPWSQIIMRIPSNVYMSLALAGIFYYFIRFYSLFAGFYALAVALVSPMVWIYWVEARPYSLWFLLTTIQLLLFLITCRSESAGRPYINKFIYGIHFLLVLTTPGSILQICIISLLLFLKGGYKKRQLVWSCFLPMGVFLFYYFFVPAYKIRTFFYFTILFEAVMPERLFVYVIYALTAWGVFKKHKESSSNAFFLPVFLLFPRI